MSERKFGNQSEECFSLLSGSFEYTIVRGRSLPCALVMFRLSASAFFFRNKTSRADLSHLDRQKHKMSEAGGGCNKLFFGNIAFKASENDVRSLCEPFGVVEEGKMRKEMPWSVLTSIDRVLLSASAFKLKF